MDKNMKRRKDRENNMGEWIKSISIALATAIFIKTFIFNITYVKGDSMNPSLEERDRLILKRYETVLKTEKYKRGDIIVFKSPIEGDDRSFIKRVIGIPGDKINISQGSLYINDEHIEESYIQEDAYTEALLYGEDYLVGEDELFVIGDNRYPGKSNDSRGFGAVDLREIQGKVVYRIFPINKVGKDL